MLSLDKKRSLLKLRVRGQHQVIKVVELDEVVEMLIGALIGVCLNTPEFNKASQLDSICRPTSKSKFHAVIVFKRDGMMMPSSLPGRNWKMLSNVPTLLSTVVLDESQKQLVLLI